MVRQRLFESQLKLTEDAENQPPKMDWLLVFTTALFAAGAIFLMWLLLIEPYLFPMPKESFMLNSFLTIDLLAGIYVYRSVAYKRLTHSLIAILTVPFLFLLVTIIIGFFGNNIGRLLISTSSKL